MSDHEPGISSVYGKFCWTTMKKGSGQTNFQILVGNVGNPKCCISFEKRHLLQVCLQKKQGGVSSFYAWGWW